MELGLLTSVFGWLLYIDLSCIVCNWDPATNSWIPAAGTAAAGTGLGLNDLFGPFYDLPTVQIPGGASDPTDPASYPGATPPSSDTAPAGGNAPSGPIDPHLLQNEEVALHNTSDANTDEIADAYERHQQEQRDYYQQTHPDATTAPPPEPTYQEQAADFFWRAMENIGK